MTLRLALFLVAALPLAASAQGDMMQKMRDSLVNQVGVMQYCQGRGWADQAAVDAQRGALASLPPGTGPAGDAAAEAAGQKGMLVNNGPPMSLASMADQSKTSEQALCGKLAESAKMMSAQRRAMPAGMPMTMPGMPAMPAMPGGMAMPAMPTMPRAP